MKSKYISPTAVASALGGAVTRQTIIRWIHEGKIAATRIGVRFKIEKSVSDALARKAKAGESIP